MSSSQVTSAAALIGFRLPQQRRGENARLPSMAETNAQMQRKSLSRFARDGTTLEVRQLAWTLLSLLAANGTTAPLTVVDVLELSSPAPLVLGAADDPHVRSSLELAPISLPSRAASEIMRELFTKETLVAHGIAT